MRWIVGLTGSNAAGKGEVASHLASRGFRVHSLSDIVREAASAEGVPPTREHLIRLGNELRRDGGASVLAERILPRLEAPAVVDSIRNPAEVGVLRTLPEFVLVGVEAPLATRFARTLARARPGDPVTLEKYRRREAQENADDPRAQQLAKTFALADHVLENDGSLAGLGDALDVWLAGRDPAADR